MAAAPRAARSASGSPATVSVVIPHYGDPAPALTLLRDLARQTDHDVITEVIVVDDASPTPFPGLGADTNVDVIADHVRVIRRDTNSGFGATVNAGARAATGDLLLILNSDLDLGPTFVADLVAASAPWQPAVTGPAVLDHSGHHTWSGRHFPTTAHQVTEWLSPLARFRDRTSLHEAVGHDTRAIPGTTVAVDWLVGAALLIPRDSFLAVGGFDERFHMNAEEVELQRRLRAHGIPSVFLGGVSVTHEGGGSSDAARRRQWLVESRFRYAGKWGGEGSLRMGLRAATAANLVANTARRLAGNHAVDPLSIAREEWALTTGPTTGRRR